MYRLLWTLLSMSFFLLAAVAVAQTAQECNGSTVIVSAVDPTGAPVKNLAAADFRASYRGRPVSVSSSQFSENPPGRVLVLLDLSASMLAQGNSSNKWKIARAMASEFVSSAPAGTQISFASFASTVQQRFPASGGRPLIQEWLASYVREGSQPKGRTALYEAIRTAINELSPGEPGDAIYVITDGEDNLSHTKAPQVEPLLLSSGTRLFAFLMSRPESAQAARLEPSPQDLEDLARHSGGAAISLDAHVYSFGGEHYPYDDKVMKDIRASTRTIQTQMTNFYVLTIDGMDPLAKQKDLSLKLVDAQGHKRNDVSLAYPRWPVQCSQ